LSSLYFNTTSNTPLASHEIAALASKIVEYIRNLIFKRSVNPFPSLFFLSLLLTDGSLFLSDLYFDQL